jgi:hypothetical protein
MGRPGSAMSPANRISADSMAAKIGRWIKNEDIFIDNPISYSIFIR